MQGFYIYRQGRLIHNGSWLGLRQQEPHGTLARVMLSFNHELDEAFNVDLKKSQILINNEIFNFLKNKFLGTPYNEAEKGIELQKVNNQKLNQRKHMNHQIN